MSRKEQQAIDLAGKYGNRVNELEKLTEHLQAQLNSISKLSRGKSGITSLSMEETQRKQYFEEQLHLAQSQLHQLKTQRVLELDQGLVSPTRYHRRRSGGEHFSESKDDNSSHNSKQKQDHVVVSIKNPMVDDHSDFSADMSASVLREVQQSTRFFLFLIIIE